MSGVYIPIRPFGGVKLCFTSFRLTLPFQGERFIGRLFAMNRIGYLIVLSLLTLAPFSILAAGRILGETEAFQADATALTAEAELIKSIGMGIALSLSLCEGQIGCNPNVNKDELEHLLKTLDKRINDLVSRQERKEGDYTEVITAYVNQREAYLGYQADLDKITGGATGSEDLGKDTFGETATPEETTSVKTAPAKKAAVATPAKKEKAGGAETDLDVFSDVDKPVE